MSAEINDQKIILNRVLLRISAHIAIGQISVPEIIDIFQNRMVSDFFCHAVS